MLSDQWTLGKAGRIGAGGAAILGIALVVAFVDQLALASTAPSPEQCSRGAPGPPPRNPWKAAHRDLAPPGAVGIRLCKYPGYGSDSDPNRALIRGVSLSDRGIDMLIRDFDALRLKPHPKPGFTSCPPWSPTVVAHLAYANGHSVTIYVPDTEWCPSVSNGDLWRSWPGKALSRLVRELLHLTRWRPPSLRSGSE